jgi:hypothetical protein
MVEAVGVERFDSLITRKLLNRHVYVVHHLHRLPGRLYRICTVTLIFTGGGGCPTFSNARSLSNDKTQLLSASSKVDKILFATLVVLSFPTM